MLNAIYIDCMPGPTHHYGGHAVGNIASQKSKSSASNPQQAALEWLEKVWQVHQLGGIQLIMPPHRRPLSIHRKHPQLHHLSSAFMWMANAGYFFPSVDSHHNDHCFIPSFMCSSSHRNKEHTIHRYWINKMLAANTTVLTRINLNDEGAANHIRLWGDINRPALNVFVHAPQSTQVKARQTMASIKKVLEKVQLKHALLLTQNATAIDAGVFHNDIISFGFQNKLFCHQASFENQKDAISLLNKKYHNIFQQPLHVIEVSNNELTLPEAVESYLFNSQIILTSTGATLLCPQPVASHPKARPIVNKWVSEGHIQAACFTPIQSSLMNGGGPACLRLSVYLNDHEIDAIPSVFFMTNQRYLQLKGIILALYPTTFSYANSITNDSVPRDIVREIEQLFKVTT